MKTGFRSSIFRILRVTLVVLALIGAAVWLRRTLTSLESEQAVINAEIIQIRTPIKGQLEIGDIRQGMLLKKGDPLFKITDARFGDRETVSQYNALQTLVESLNSELMGARHQLELAEIAQERAQRLYKSNVIARAAKELEETKFEMAKKLVEAKSQQLARSEVRAQGNGRADGDAKGIHHRHAGRRARLVRRAAVRRRGELQHARHGSAEPCKYLGGRFFRGAAGAGSPPRSAGADSLAR
jgi:multidrug resistance efflux pump